MRTTFNLTFVPYNEREQLNYYEITTERNEAFSFST